MYLIGPLVTSLVAVAGAVALDVGLPHSSVGIHWLEGIGAAIPCVWLVVRFVRWRTTGLVITSFRLVERHGVMSRRGAEIRLSQIQRVDVVQSLFRRMVGTGQLEVTAWGEEDILTIGDVRKPMVLQRIINRRIPPTGGYEGGPGG
jgi:uncharacterized membrane protein YdbT with pleckstrin-like domain